MTRSIDPKTSLGTVRLIVADLGRSLSFYGEDLGFGILEREEKTAALTADGMTSLVHLEEREGAQPRPADTTGLYHYAILLPERADLGRCLRHLLQLGVRLGSSDHGFSEALYLKDPDGNGIEIYADRPRSSWRGDDGELPAVSDPLDGEGLLTLAGDSSWNGFPPTSRIGHIHLHVADLEQAEKFYVRGLGFEVTIHWNGALFVSAGGYHHHVGLNTWAGVGAPPPPPDSAGLRSFTVTVPDGEEMERLSNRLREIGAPAGTDGDAIRTTDPFGNRLRIERR